MQLHNFTATLPVYRTTRYCRFAADASLRTNGNGDIVPQRFLTDVRARLDSRIAGGH
jgi:hypothetical protein